MTAKIEAATIANRLQALCIDANSQELAVKLSAKDAGQTTLKRFGHHWIAGPKLADAEMDALVAAFGGDTGYRRTTLDGMTVQWSGPMGTLLVKLDSKTLH